MRDRPPRRLAEVWKEMALIRSQEMRVKLQELVAEALEDARNEGAEYAEEVKKQCCTTSVGYGSDAGSTHIPVTNPVTNEVSNRVGNGVGKDGSNGVGNLESVRIVTV